MTPRTQVIPIGTCVRERWKNGEGWTREILRWPAQGDWDWRLSIAEIERDSEFSSFPGIDRELVLLSGNGLRLRFDGGECRQLEPPHASARFDGERAVRGELLDGPTTDFNLMWRRARIDAQLWHRLLTGPMVVFVEPRCVWAVHALGGHVSFASECGLPDLAAGDTAILAAGDARGRYALDGGGEVLLIRLQPRD